MAPENCWEYWDCPEDVKEKCPAYETDSGKDCYDLAKDYCPKLKQAFKNCWECPWCKKVKSQK